MAVLPVGIGSAEEGGYQIERSLRFNSADSTSLNRTPASASNRKTWTWSGWVKRCEISTTERTFFGAGTDGNNFTALAWINDALYLQNYTGGSQVVTNTTAVYRDASAWYHIVLALDTTQATAANRAKIYVNGVQQAGFSGSSFSLNQDFWVNFTYAHRIGSRQLSSADSFSNQYMTEINFIDGSALDPTSFGEFNSDTGVWQPKKYTGTYGTNGFYLNFSDNSGTTSTTLGKDSSGNGNNWTTNNFSVTAGAGNDSLVDSPTRYGTDTGAGGEVRGNYCTLNPVDPTSWTLTNGNLKATRASGDFGVRATMALPTNGKWYWEVLCTDAGAALGIQSTSSGINTAFTSAVAWVYDAEGDKWNNGVETAYGNAITDGAIFQVAVDMDNSKIFFGINNTWQGSGNPVTGANAAFTNVTGNNLVAVAYRHSGAADLDFNFGQRPFAYTAPSGFKALVTTNLPEPTIAAGNEYFDASLWTGNNGTQSIVNTAGFAPDLVWLKNRTNAFTHLLYDTIRGAGTLKAISSSETTAEGGMSDNATFGYLSTLNSDGFTVVSGSTANSYTNSNSNAYVGWQWKANGAGVSNTDGTRTSTVSVNATSGFSIVTYSGNATRTITVGHGLGVVPAMIIVKNRSTDTNWPVFHRSVGASKNLYLNTTQAETTDTSMWNNTAPTSTVFSLGDTTGANGNGNNMVAYCFAPVAGYSAFGSYTGNGSADGPFVFTGFRPRWIMYKNASASATVWIIFDTARNTYNFVDAQLRPNESSAENSAGASFSFDLLSNGFKVRSSDSNLNGSGNTMIFAAFAENPFAYSLAR